MGGGPGGINAKDESGAMPDLASMSKVRQLPSRRLRGSASQWHLSASTRDGPNVKGQRRPVTKDKLENHPASLTMKGEGD